MKNWKCTSNIKNFTQFKEELKERYLVLVIYTDSKVKECYPGVPSDVVEMLSHPIEGEVQDIDRITEQEIIEIEQKHAMVPKR